MLDLVRILLVGRVGASSGLKEDTVETKTVFPGKFSVD
jgi:hypothetical protein